MLYNKIFAWFEPLTFINDSVVPFLNQSHIHFSLESYFIYRGINFEIMKFTSTKSSQLLKPTRILVTPVLVTLMVHDSGVRLATSVGKIEKLTPYLTLTSMFSNSTLKCLIYISA